MNPRNMMQFMTALGNFKSNHPKFMSFIEHFMRTGLPEGTVIEVTVTPPDGESITSNMKVMESDLELIRAMSEMR